MNNILHFNNINDFKMDISYIELNADSPQNVNDHHIHDESEIYINLSGDVSFAVENSVYPIMPGNILITRPYEYHHCIYHSNKLHKHFWILVQSAHNKDFFDIFYNRPLGQNNLLILDFPKQSELMEICRKLSAGANDNIEKYCCFFGMIKLLREADTFSPPASPNDNYVTIAAIDYINSNFSSKISVKQLAKICNVSIITLERHFLSTFNLSPTEYIKKRRLAHATKLLSKGSSVTDAAYYSGFSDCSGFIVSFKQAYGVTPLQYKKNCSKKP